MATMALAQVSGDQFTPYFTITNQTSGDGTTISVEDFSSWGEAVTFPLGVYNGDVLVFTYKDLPSPITPQLTWSSAWMGASLASLGTGKTKEVTVKNVPTSTPLNNILLVQCDYTTSGFGISTSKTYLFRIPNVKQGNRVTAKNINASEVQVSYADYEKVASAGQRASIALYDIYGNLVSTGYLDGLGMGTLSTKGKPGIYIVKVTMNNQVVFNQRIQVK